MAERKARKAGNRAQHVIITRVLGAAVLAGAGISPLLIAPAANAAVVPAPPGAIVVGTASPTCPSPSFSTIQAAVTAAAANATIYVCAGTYNETVTIDKNLTLLGAQFGVPAAGRANPAAETIVTSATSAFTYAATATTGTINGFDIQGTTGTQNGIVVVGTAGTGFTWTSNIINADGNGINFHTTGTTPTTIKYNKITNNAGAGGVFIASGPAANVTIDNNNFSGNATAINTTGAGTVAGPLSDHVSIDYNVSVNDGNFVMLFLADHVQITHNRITWLNPFSILAGSAVYISGGSENVGVSANYIAGGAADGVNINNAAYSTLPPSGVALSLNSVTLRLNGIHIEPSSNMDQTASGVTIITNQLANSGLGDAVMSPADGGNGIWLQGGSGTQLTNNAAGSSVSTDCRDETTGTGTLGTANTWTGNFGVTSFPAGLCTLPVP